RPAWIQEYDDIFKQDELVAALRWDAPEVLEWHERRLDMILLAERLAVTPPDTSIVFKERRITSRTMRRVQRAIAELFRLREQIDSAIECQALHGRDGSKQRQVQEALRGLAFHFDILKAYGITAE